MAAVRRSSGERRRQGDPVGDWPGAEGGAMTWMVVGACWDVERPLRLRPIQRPGLVGRSRCLNEIDLLSMEASQEKQRSTATKKIWQEAAGTEKVRVPASLIPPMLTVMADGYHLLVELEHLGPAFEFLVLYWRKGQENQVYEKVVRDSNTTVHLETMEAGAEYCVKAQTYVEAINRSSNFSQVQCVTAADSKAFSVIFAPIFFIAFVVAVFILFLLAWKTCQVCQYSCCPNEGLPDTLKLTESPAGILNYRGEEAEKCDMSVHVQPPDELLRFWIHDAL
ncbi:UNVERIFIED_CONTAM: hypothetical protein K2H54_041037 [Gekko kuhli]